MKTIVPTIVITAALSASMTAFAQAPSAPQSPHTFTGNLGFVTDYRFRGISQTYKLPALQGGFDYSHSSGLYLGTWASNVNSSSNAFGVAYANGAGLEWDMYGGYKFEPIKDLGLDLGVLYYYYPGARYVVTQKTKYDNLEIYLGASYKWFSAKYSNTLTDYFGTNNNTFGAPVGGNNANTANGYCGLTSAGVAQAATSPDCLGAAPGGSKNSGYLDLNGTFEVGEKMNLGVHVGHQSVKHYNKLSYTDYKLSLTKEWGWFTWGAAIVGTNANANLWRGGQITGSAIPAGSAVSETKDLRNTTLVLSVSKTF